MKQKWKTPRKSKVSKAKAIVAQAAVTSGKNTVLKQMIRRVVTGIAETKTASFYQTYNNGTTPGRATGAFASRGYATQNNEILNNPTDIFQLIPAVAQGNSDNQRLGDQITPTSLTVKGEVRVRKQNILDANVPLDIKVVIYVLQHVSLKDYTNLYSQNNFNQLLETGENSTVRFYGNSVSPKLKVANQYYRVLKRKIITLRHAGVTNYTGGLNYAVSQANAHNWFGEYTFSLGKHLPKTLKYPENSVTGTTLNEPTNSSIFMCMGFYDQNENPDLTVVPTNGQLEQFYVSQLTWKDM